MAKDSTPVTAAIRALRAAKVAFETHTYRYEARGGTKVSSRELGVSEHAVIKTLIMQDDTTKPLVVLMHGDCKVSTKELARQIGARAIAPCDPATAEKHSGYQVGGTSPFGLKKPLPIYAESSIQALSKLFINGGRRGMLVSMAPAELARALSPVWVEAAISDASSSDGED